MKIDTENMSRSEKVLWAKRLRASGRTYVEIDLFLCLPIGKSWQLINRERHLKSSRESSRRWIERGKIALCDMPAGDPAYQTKSIKE